MAYNTIDPADWGVFQALEARLQEMAEDSKPIKGAYSSSDFIRELPSLVILSRPLKEPLLFEIIGREDKALIELKIEIWADQQAYKEMMGLKRGVRKELLARPLALKFKVKSPENEEVKHSAFLILKEKSSTDNKKTPFLLFQGLIRS